MKRRGLRAEVVNGRDAAEIATVEALCELVNEHSGNVVDHVLDRLVLLGRMLDGNGALEDTHTLGILVEDGFDVFGSPWSPSKDVSQIPHTVHRSLTFLNHTSKLASSTEMSMTAGPTPPRRARSLLNASRRDAEAKLGQVDVQRKECDAHASGDLSLYLCNLGMESCCIVVAASEFNAASCREDGADKASLEGSRCHASNHDRGLAQEAREGSVEVDLAIAGGTSASRNRAHAHQLTRPKPPQISRSTRADTRCGRERQ